MLVLVVLWVINLSSFFWSLHLQQLNEFCIEQSVKYLPRYLFYDDDIIIFLRATRANGRNIHKLLLEYGQLSDQIYSPSKSRIFYNDKSTTHFKTYVRRCTSITTGVLPFLYLGISIFEGSPTAMHLEAIVDNIIHKFTRWKGHTISLAYRKCSINSVIAISLIHTMMIYK